MNECLILINGSDSDESEEMVTTDQKGNKSIILWELNGQTIRSFATWLSRMLLAAGDLDGDGLDEIITASRFANRNAVSVYTAEGDTVETIELFDQNTRIAPAVGDINGDGKDDIIAGNLSKIDQVVIYDSATQ